jgi:hypothetical protein
MVSLTLLSLYRETFRYLFDPKIHMETFVTGVALSLSLSALSLNDEICSELLYLYYSRYTVFLL